MTIKKRKRKQAVETVSKDAGSQGGTVNTVETVEHSDKTVESKELDITLEFGQPIRIGHGYWLVERETGRRHGAYATKVEAQKAYQELKKTYEGMVVFSKT